MPDYSLNDYYGPLPFPRDWKVVDISTDDFVDEKIFAARAVGAGALSYETSEGTPGSMTAKAGEYIAPDVNYPALLRKVSASSAVGSIIVIYYQR